LNSNKKFLIIYGSLNSVPSPEGAAPAKVIYETVVTSPLNHFKALSNYNKSLNEIDYDKDLFKQVRSTKIDTFLLFLLKIRYPYKKRREKFITGNDKHLLYYISVCRWLFFKDYDKIIVHVGVGLVQMLKMVFPKKEIIYYHHGTSLHSKLSESQWMLLINNIRALFGVNKIALKKANETFISKFEPAKYFNLENAIIFSERDQIKISELRHKLKPDEFKFAFTGRICVEKGVLNLLKSYLRVSQVNEKNCLYIIGGAGTKGTHDKITPYVQECRDFVKKHKLNVIFTGFLNKELLMFYLSRMDAVVCPTDKQLYEEGMPLSIIEALSFGKPVIATDSGGIAEVVIDNINGILIKSYPYVDEMALEMINLSSDKILYKKLSKGAYNSFLEKHTYNSYHKSFKTALIKSGFIS
jgi:glycosyltransferase involved in cell wall biosynthesis